jgi:hypothetical protein
MHAMGNLGCSTTDSDAAGMIGCWVVSHEACMAAASGWVSAAILRECGVTPAAAHARVLQSADDSMYSSTSRCMHQGSRVAGSERLHWLHMQVCRPEQPSMIGNISTVTLNATDRLIDRLTVDSGGGCP